MGHKFVDLSHTIEDGLITYKGLPAPIICDFMSREEWARTHYMEEPFHIGKIEMVANTGAPGARRCRARSVRCGGR